MLPLLAGACRIDRGKEIPYPEPTPEIPAVKPDTTLLRSTIRAAAPFPVERLDVFVYNSGGLTDLVGYVRAEGPEVSLDLPDSLPKRVAAVANVKGEFNTAALGHYDSLEGLVYSFADENPSAPVMSGKTVIVPGEEAGVSLTPLLCTVEITEVTNYYEDDILAENPRVKLLNINGAAGIFTSYGFPVRDPLDGGYVFLPHDVGIYSMYPGTKLYCYPNDLPGPTESNPATVLVFECETGGETRHLEFVLHPLERGTYVPIQVEIRPYG